MNNTMTCRVQRGELKNGDAVALGMALDDLRVYWEKAFGAGSFLLDDEQPEREADLDLLIGAAENLPAIAALEKNGKIEALQVSEQGFALDLLTSGKRRTAVLRAADRLGLQYAVYSFAEQFLGVRFVHPLLDLQPETPPMPKELRVVETPPRPLRILHEGSHVTWDGWGTESKIAHFSDLVAWRWEDWAGNPERMLRYIAWGVKNRVSIITFDDTCLNGGAKTNRRMFVSDAIWECMDARGINTVMWCGPGYPRNSPADAYSTDDLCTHERGAWNQGLCFGKPAFWQEAEDWLDILAPHGPRLEGIWTNWQENGMSQGVDYDAQGRPFLSKGGGCKVCGDIENVEKWVRHLEYVQARTAEHGLPPAGIMRTFWMTAPPDDGMVAERVVPHLPPNSLNLVACLPSASSAERVKAWPRLMDEINAADNGNRRIMLYRELQFTCSSDIPLVPLRNLDRVDDDFRVFGRYRSFAGPVYSVYVHHSMGWLMVLYALRKQWQPELEWRSWFRAEFQGLLGERFVDAFLDAADLLRDVELLEGLTEGEGGCDYYGEWALNISRLSPETLPQNGPLQAVGYYGNPDEKFKRMVKKGSMDTPGDYTSERCAPALKRILSMRGKIERALERIGIMAAALPAGVDGPQWNDLILLPLRVTARFLQGHLLLAQSRLTYIRLRENHLAGRDTKADAVEGLNLCRWALDAQTEYIRLRPGFCRFYPMEINPAALRNLAGWWKRLARDPVLCRDMDICAFLDKAERETEAGANIGRPTTSE